MDTNKVRDVLDGMDEAQLMQLRDSVEESQDGSMHEFEGVQLTKEQLLKMINQSLPVQGS